MRAHTSLSLDPWPSGRRLLSIPDQKGCVRARANVSRSAVLVVEHAWDAQKALKRLGLVKPDGVDVPKVVFLCSGLFQHEDLMEELLADMRRAALVASQKQSQTSASRSVLDHWRSSFGGESVESVSVTDSELGSFTRSRNRMSGFTTRRRTRAGSATSDAAAGLLPMYSTVRSFASYINSCPQELKDAGIFSQLFFAKFPSSALLQRVAIAHAAESALVVTHDLGAPSTSRSRGSGAASIEVSGPARAARRLSSLAGAAAQVVQFRSLTSSMLPNRPRTNSVLNRISVSRPQSRSHRGSCADVAEVSEREAATIPSSVHGSVAEAV